MYISTLKAFKLSFRQTLEIKANSGQSWKSAQTFTRIKIIFQRKSETQKIDLTVSDNIKENFILHFISFGYVGSPDHKNTEFRLNSDLDFFLKVTNYLSYETKYSECIFCNFVCKNLIFRISLTVSVFDLFKFSSNFQIK